MKRVICLFLAYQFLLMNFNLNSSQAYAQDGKVQCTEEYKLGLLVRKGIMTKDTCFELEGNKLKLNVTGRTYKLAQTLDTQVNHSNNTPNGGLVCEGITTDLDGDSVKVSESDFLNKTAFGNFGMFLTNLRGEIAKLKTKLIEEGSTEEANALNNNITLTGTGYADGVRVTSPGFDQEIFNDAGNILYKPAFDVIGKGSESFENKRKAFQDIACKWNKDRASVTDSRKLKFLHNIRNIAIAKRRARNLTSVIKDMSSLPSTPVLKTVTSDEIADTRNAGCYGYCALRRGATVDIEIPGLEYYAFGVRKEDVEIAPSFNTPASHDQVIMNAMAMRTFAKDYQQWLIQKLREDSAYVGNGSQYLLAFMYIYSLKTGNGQSKGDRLVYAQKKTLRMLPYYLINKIAPDVYLKMRDRLLEYNSDDSRRGFKALAQEALTDTGRLSTRIDGESLNIVLYKHKNDYIQEQMSDYQSVIDNLKSNFLLSIESYVQEKYEISQADLTKFQDLIKWTSTALTYTIKDSVDIYIPPSRIRYRLQNSNLPNNFENSQKIIGEEFFKELKHAKSLFTILPLANMTYGSGDSLNTRINSKAEDSALPSSFGVALSNEELQQLIVGTFFDYVRLLAAKKAELNKDINKISKEAIKKAYLESIGEYGYEKSMFNEGTKEFNTKFDQYINSNQVGSKAIDLILEDMNAELSLRMSDLVSRSLLISSNSSSPVNIGDVTFPAKTYYYKDRVTGVSIADQISPISLYLNKLAMATSDTQTKAFINDLNRVYYYLVKIAYLFNSRTSGVNDNKKNINLFPDNMMRSGDGGDTSAIFSFMDYRDAYAATLNHTTNNNTTSLFNNTNVMLRQLRPISDDRDVQRIFFDVSKINTAWNHRSGNTRTLFKGFFHTACLTGVIYPMDGQTTEFNYQSRMLHHKKDGRNMQDYQAYDNGSKGPNEPQVYDYTFDLPNKYPKMNFFNLAALKRPTSYLIPNCGECGCLQNGDNQQDRAGQVDGFYLKEVLERAKVLDFSQGYKWLSKESNPDIKYPEKSFTKADLGISEPISGDYCLFSPLVPQSHNLGSGNSAGTPNTGGEKEDEVICPIADATKGIEELDLTLDEINDVIRTCASVMRRFPMSEADCENSKLNNKCLLLDKAGFEAAGISEANIPIQNVLTGEWTGSSDCLAPASQKPPTKMCNSNVLLSR